MAFFRTESWNNILFKDIRKYPVLKGDEEKDALERMINGDMRSRELLINSNLRLVMSMDTPCMTSLRNTS